MSELLIVLALTAVGKIHGQGAVASQVLHLQSLPVNEHRSDIYFERERLQTPAPTPQPYTNAFRPSVQESLRDNGSDNINLTPSNARLRFQTSPPTPRLYTNAFRPTVHKNSQDNGSDDINLRQTAVNGNQPKRKLFISVTLPPEMHRPLDIVETTNSRTRQNSDEIKKENIMKEDLLSSNNKANVIEVPAITNNENKNKPAEKPKPNSEGIPAVVDLGERSSFDGDMCPPGYVRIKDVCVEKD